MSGVAHKYPLWKQNSTSHAQLFWADNALALDIGEWEGEKERRMSRSIYFGHEIHSYVVRKLGTYSDISTRQNKRASLLKWQYSERPAPPVVLDRNGSRSRCKIQHFFEEGTKASPP
jgi:hypothetical protein